MILGIIFFLFFIVICNAVDEVQPKNEWIEYISPDGLKYYHNPLLETSTWEKPSGSVVVPQLSKDNKRSSKVPLEIEIHRNYYTSISRHASDGITLALQMDLKRKGCLQRHAERWNGPLSVSMLILQSQWGELKEFIASMHHNLKQHMNLHVAVAFSKWSHYPINRMRNFAMEGVDTQWTFVIDSDEDTMFDMATYSIELHRAISKLSAPDLSKSVFVITSWQWATESRGNYPGSKQSLRDMYSNKDHRLIDVKAPHFPKAYKPPTLSLDQWLLNTQTQPIGFGDCYEPYFIAVTGAVPEFDPRFIGWGANKAIQTLTMASNGFRFFLLPNVFSFVSDTPRISSSHSPPADPSLFERAFKELGKQHGCDSCTIDNCVQNCPWMVKVSKAALVSSDETKKTEFELPKLGIKVAPAITPIKSENASTKNKQNAMPDASLLHTQKM